MEAGYILGGRLSVRLFQKKKWKRTDGGTGWGGYYLRFCSFYICMAMGGSAPRSLQSRALMVPNFLRDVKAFYGVWESDAHSAIATDGALF